MGQRSLLTYALADSVGPSTQRTCPPMRPVQRRAANQRSALSAMAQSGKAGEAPLAADRLIGEFSEIVGVGYYSHRLRPPNKYTYLSNSARALFYPVINPTQARTLEDEAQEPEQYSCLVCQRPKARIRQRPCIELLDLHCASIRIEWDSGCVGGCHEHEFKTRSRPINRSIN